MEKVTIKLQGGLGNLMFQIAVVYAYSKKHNKEYVFSLEEFSGNHHHVEFYKNNILRNINFVNQYKFSKFFRVQESGFHYTPIPYYKGNVYLFGYYQSENYFKEFNEDIMQLFSCSNKKQLHLKEFLKNHYHVDFEKDETCSIHVRHGDYLNLPNHHPIQNINYYMKAIKQMPTDSKFLIFSDDIEWCKHSFPNIPDKFIFINNFEDYEDLTIMSFCNNNIIANSSFSWWGAWLNNNKSKKVIAPSKWFGPSIQVNTKDLYCKDWIII